MCKVSGNSRPLAVKNKELAEQFSKQFDFTHATKIDNATSFLTMPDIHINVWSKCTCIRIYMYSLYPEDDRPSFAHLSAEDILKSAVSEEKKFKHSPWAGADNPLVPKFLCQQEGLITMVICCKIKKNLFNL